MESMNEFVVHSFNAVSYLASFPGSHASECEYWSCAGMEIRLHSGGAWERGYILPMAHIVALFPGPTHLPSCPASDRKLGNDLGTRLPYDQKTKTSLEMLSRFVSNYVIVIAHWLGIYKNRIYNFLLV